jgi:hypothetical protein
LTYPNHSDGIVGYFGPNMSLEGSTVPAPGALLLLVTGLFGIPTIRRRLS